MKKRLQGIVLVLIAFMLGCNEFIIVGILSDVSRQFGQSVATVGYLVTLFALAYAISTPIINVMISRFNRYKSLACLMVIFIIGNTYSAMADSYAQLVISRIIAALTAGSIISLCLAFATVIAPIGKRAFLVSWIFSGFSIASVFGVPIGTAISTNWGWRYSFYAITIVSIIAFIAMLWLLPRKVPQTKSSLLKQLTICKDPRIIFGVLLAMFSAAGSYVIFTYLRPIMTQSLGFPISGISLLLFLYGVTSIISNQLSGFIATKYGLRKMPLIYLIQTIVFVLLPISLVNQWIGLTDLLIVGLLMYLLNSPIQIHFLNVAEHDYPQSLVLASSFNSIFFNFGISIGSAAGALIVAHSRLGWTGVGAAVFAGISIVLSAMLIRSNSQTHMIKSTGK
ncbi:MFS transporter [Lentilactobacillus hilgardii]|uniref:MFS transporter n=1 Tax=Lentilactobacillus hilgardii TaxID=1588 RepID=UPI002889104B|nr:MFS transporter [Lentilactobacillus hilgardii]